MHDNAIMLPATDELATCNNYVMRHDLVVIANSVECMYKVNVTSFEVKRG